MAGQCSDAREQLRKEVHFRRSVVVASAEQGDAHGKHVVRDAAHVGGAQALIALEQQTGAHQQHYCQANFEREQRLAQTHAAVAGAGCARRLLERCKQAVISGNHRPNDSGKERAKQDEPDREGHHEAVDVDGFDAVHIRAGVHQPVDCDPGNQDSRRATGNGKKQALHEVLAQQAQAAAAKRHADSLLLAPRRTARHKKVGNVEAGDEKHASGGGEEHVERPARVHHHVLQQGPNNRRLADDGIVQVRIVEPARNQCQIRGGLFRRYARPQTPDDFELVIAQRLHPLGRFVVIDRRQQLHRRVLGVNKPGRQYADDGVGAGVDVDGLIDNGGVGAKTPLP
jgi:hypothetical protein